MFSYVLAVIALTAIPGPGLLTIFGIGSAFGYRAGIRFTLGVYIGANLTTLIVFSGLSALFTGFPALRNILFVFSLLYFTYFAFRIALAGSELGISTQKLPGCKAGIILMLVNPKAYMTMSALYLGFPLLAFEPLNEAMIKVVIANIIWIPGHLLWLYAGVGVNRLQLSKKTKKGVNIIFAIIILIAVFGSTIATMSNGI